MYPSIFWRKCSKPLTFSPWVWEEDNYSADKSEMLTMSQVSVYSTLKQRAKTASETVSFPQRNLGLRMSMKCNSWDGNSPKHTSIYKRLWVRGTTDCSEQNNKHKLAQPKIRWIQIWPFQKKVFLLLILMIPSIIFLSHGCMQFRTILCP